MLVGKEEVVYLLNSHESKIKSMMQGVVTKLHDKLDNNLKIVQLDVTEVHNVARE